MLNAMYSIFDTLTERKLFRRNQIMPCHLSNCSITSVSGNNVYKVETIGDAYMVRMTLIIRELKFDRFKFVSYEMYSIHLITTRTPYWVENLFKIS